MAGETEESSSSGTSAGTDDTSSTSQTTAQPTGSTAQPTSSTDPSGSSSGGDTQGVPDTCGDGVVDEEEGEVCDDGNAIDEDGCNIDCLSSGSLLWSWTPPKGETLRAGGFSPSDELWVATESETEIAVRAFSHAGEPGEVTNIPGLSPPAARSNPSPAYVDVEVGDAGPYVGLGYEWLTPDGFELGGRVQQVGEGGWTVDLEDGLEAIELRASDHGIYVVSRSSIVEAFDANGASLWRVEPDVGNINGIRTTANGLLLVAARGVAEIRDIDGSTAWEYDPKSDVNWTHGDVGPDALWIWGRADLNGHDGRLLRLSHEGTFVEVLTQQDPGDVNAVTPGGFLVRARVLGVRMLEKFSPSLAPLWIHDFMIGGPQDLAVDSRGGVAFMTDWELWALAP